MLPKSGAAAQIIQNNGMGTKGSAANSRAPPGKYRAISAARASQHPAIKWRLGPGVGRSPRIALANHTVPVALGQTRISYSNQHKIKACTP